MAHGLLMSDDLVIKVDGSPLGDGWSQVVVKKPINLTTPLLTLWLDTNN